MKSSDETIASYLKKLYRFIDYRTPFLLHNVIFLLYNRKHKQALIERPYCPRSIFYARGNRLSAFRIT